MSETSIMVGSFRWNHDRSPIVSPMPASEAYRGQGDSSTM